MDLFTVIISTISLPSIIALATTTATAISAAYYPTIAMDFFTIVVPTARNFASLHFRLSTANPPSTTDLVSTIE